MEIADNGEPADNNSENNGHNRSYEPVFPDCFIKEQGDQIKLKDHAHRPQRTIDGTMSQGEKFSVKYNTPICRSPSLLNICVDIKDQKDRDTYIILGHNADTALFQKSASRGETSLAPPKKKGKDKPHIRLTEKQCNSYFTSKSQKVVGWLYATAMAARTESPAVIQHIVEDRPHGARIDIFLIRFINKSFPEKISLPHD